MLDKTPVAPSGAFPVPKHASIAGQTNEVCMSRVRYLEVI
jgi:hypothetical protein